MKTNLKKYFFIIFVLSIFIFPVLVSAQEDTGGLTYECFDGTYYGNCTFNDLISATIRVINRVIPIAIGFCVVVIAYAGFTYMQSGSNPGKRAEANRMLRYVAIGIFFIMAAWLVVSLIANTLLDPSFRDVTPIMNP